MEQDPPSNASANIAEAPKTVSFKDACRHAYAIIDAYIEWIKCMELSTDCYNQTTPINSLL